ncbi:RsmB/NOP family class I SAM-dependent RNA methyltransferase [Rhodoblastus acidophilus]|uniref:RsmB/NOP family class I SAM-dependent RNA methyltransferase n=1 Tax=Candidatus Rhodoblastus alkanivorans TaxID=2954117 RepID=A0ABS9Z617_9HYPH|nr:RsmB/NOP family class I SAM-dependent RNA methyltransferase [Candidatus Rhodoblastus alkanivorans]MCI4678416.1 RsmB/NOP family class I SAM-dependent RNA methyltransferase [Candidatus Rhodoblastus alkanivorans]MCI4682911.1 RsmB/NOP family class I SAM-dependent RNA methyltransferase [Candidatus Rhodoblastus alkanivorans]MDI4640221.1 RsmB/NOP family class I SAM-dependent RNA methyltransferase [Rhodoblastus acidophilus]
MHPSARIAAAIEVLDDLETRRRPAADALKDWGLAHRFAGSKDRAGIASLVYDVLRRRASARWVMKAETPRAEMIGALLLARGLSAQEIAGHFSGEGHAPAPLSEDEKAALAAPDLSGAPIWVAGDFPEWLAPHFARAFVEKAVEEGRALAARAPLDLRVNALKATRQQSLEELAHLGAQACRFAPLGLRIAQGADGRATALSGEPAYARGLVEIQDEGSQIASRIARAAPGEQVLDLCAGGGGKSLAMAGDMENRGQIYATDSDGRRLTPIFPRLERAGARNVQVRAPRGPNHDPAGDLAGACDLVLVDAPCTGTGTWRRNPDAKWRIRPGALEQRIKAQDDVLARAALYVKPGGRLVYVTCSLLCEENEDRIAAFLAGHIDFAAEPAAESLAKAGLAGLDAAASPHGPGLRLTPARHDTDGFYAVVLLRAAG